MPEGVGAQIQRFRMERDLSLSELAAEAGVAKSYLSALESDQGDTQQRPSAETLYRLANALGVAVSDVLGRPVEQTDVGDLPPSLREFVRPRGSPGQMSTCWQQSSSVAINRRPRSGGSTSTGLSNSASRWMNRAEGSRKAHLIAASGSGAHRCDRWSDPISDKAVSLRRKGNLILPVRVWAPDVAAGERS